MGFVNLMRSHPRAVAEHRSLVLACLSDDDVTIRTRALELLSGETLFLLSPLLLPFHRHRLRLAGCCGVWSSFSQGWLHAIFLG